MLDIAMAAAPLLAAATLDNPALLAPTTFGALLLGITLAAELLPAAALLLSIALAVEFLPAATLLPGFALAVPPALGAALLLGIAPPRAFTGAALLIPALAGRVLDSELGLSAAAAWIPRQPRTARMASCESVFMAL